MFVFVLSAYDVRSGRAVQAARMLGAAETPHRVYQNVGFPWELRLYDETLQAAQVALAEEAFRSAWEEGQAIPFLQAFDLFLEEFVQSFQ